MTTSESTHPRRGLFALFLNGVEVLGNLLPHPVTLFAIFCLLVLLISGLAGWLGLEVVDPRPGYTEPIRAVSLLNGAGLRRIIENLVTNFVQFKPLGTVLVAMLGVGVAEKSGLLSAVIRSVVLNAPGGLVTAAIVFAGVLSNTASEMGYVVLVPLAAVIFHALGRHPIAGLAAAFAGVSGGYSANLVIGTVDPLLSGITQEAAQLISPGYEVHPAINWWFMAASVPMITIVGTLVTTWIVEPRLGAYDSSHAEEGLPEPTLEPLSDGERRGLVWAALSVLVGLVVVVIAALPGEALFPGWGVLRNPETGSLTGSPLLRGVVALIFIGFLIPGWVFGRFAGTIQSDRDVIDGMSGAISRLGLYVVLVFFAAQFIQYFKWTQLGTILAVVGANFLRDIGLDNAAVFVPFILMCCFVNLMIGSASAQWAATAPIFVPMLMMTGYSPEVIQAAYRIGDSTTNIITPMMSYFGLILAFAARYDRTLGIGTLVSTMLPYSICFLLGWIVLFYTWVFGLGLPVGPEAPTYFSLGQ